jgi:hypothetical protein
MRGLSTKGVPTVFLPVTPVRACSASRDISPLSIVGNAGLVCLDTSSILILHSFFWLLQFTAAGQNLLKDLPCFFASAIYEMITSFPWF